MIKPVLEEHNFEDVVIVCGGTSLVGVDLGRLANFKGAVIAVNHSVQFLPRVDFSMTVDPSAEGKPQSWLENLRKDVYYYVAQPDLERENYHGTYYQTLPGVHYLERIVPTDAYTLQKDKSRITTGDSSYGALGLAYHFGAKRITILGLDIYGTGHWYDVGRPYNLGWGKGFDAYRRRVVKIFAVGARQLRNEGIEVVNGSKDSLIRGFRKVEPLEALSLLGV